MTTEKGKALDLAISQIEKRFGKGAIMKLGDSLSSVNDNLRGVQASGGRKTATEVRTSGEAGASRLAAHSTLISAQAIVDLTGYTDPIQIRFRAVAAGEPRGDMAIDDIAVTGGLLYGDMNGDNIVNGSDLSEFTDYWLLEDCGLDGNGDCLINLHEFAAFADNWLDGSFQ